MITDAEEYIMTYNGALRNLKSNGYTTKLNKEITKMDLYQAINIMQRKHPTCRWTGMLKKYRKHYILTEGYYWLTKVYFQKEKKQIDADICFFELRIKQYEEFLKVSKKLWDRDIPRRELKLYFNRKNSSIKQALRVMRETNKRDFEYMDNDILFITKAGVEWLCKNCFKQKYLELLESYKMELTEKFMEAGYIYDNFL